MYGFTFNIEEWTKGNTDYRRVVYTSRHEQLVLMSLPPNQDVGLETHADADQFLKVEAGTGSLIIDGRQRFITEGYATLIPRGTQHNIVNTHPHKPLQIYVVYSPPQHRDNLTQKYREDPDAPWDGKTTE